MKNFKNEREGLLIIIPYFLVQLVLAATITELILSWKKLPSMSNEEVSLIENIYYMNVVGFLSLAAVCLLIYIYRASIKASIKEIRKSYKTFFKKLFLYFLVINAVSILFRIVDNIFFAEYISDAGDNEEFLREMISHANLLMLLSLAIFLPIIEEVVFRYAFISKLMHRLNKYLAAGLITFLFAFVHVGFGQMFSLEIGNTIHLFLGYLPASLALSFIYVREENLTFPIILHISNNTGAVILFLLADMLLS